MRPAFLFYVHIETRAASPNQRTVAVALSATRVPKPTLVKQCRVTLVFRLRSPTLLQACLQSTHLPPIQVIELAGKAAHFEDVRRQRSVQMATINN